MRYEELQGLIATRVTPELNNTLSALDAAILAAGFSMHREEFDMMFAEESNIDANTIVDNVVAILRVAADKVLGTMEVEVGDDIPLDRLIALVNFLITFDRSDDDDRFYALIENRTSNEEVICDMLEIVTEYDSGDYLPYITRIGDNLIETMRRDIEEGFRLNEQPEEVPQFVKERLNKWGYDKPVAIAETFEEENVPDGVDMESLYSVYSDQLLDMSPTDAVDNLVYMALHSNVSNEALIDEIEFRMESTFLSLEDNQKAHLYLQKLKPSLESLIAGDSNE